MQYSLQGTLLGRRRPVGRRLLRRPRRGPHLDGEAWVDHVAGWVAGADGLFDHLLEQTRVGGPAGPHVRQGARRAPAAREPPTEGRPDDRRTDADRAQRSLRRRLHLGAAPTSTATDATVSPGTATVWRATCRTRTWPSCRSAARRRFLLRPKGGGRSVRFDPGPGDLLVMGGTCQRDWQHAVPKVAARRAAHLAHVPPRLRVATGRTAELRARVRGRAPGSSDVLHVRVLLGDVGGRRPRRAALPRVQRRRTRPAARGDRGRRRRSPTRPAACSPSDSGHATLLSTALVVWGVLLLGLSRDRRTRWAFCVLFLAPVAGGGLVDVVMNVAGTAALGSESARLLRLHALFNAGALARRRRGRPPARPGRELPADLGRRRGRRAPARAVVPDDRPAGRRARRALHGPRGLAALRSCWDSRRVALVFAHRRSRRGRHRHVGRAVPASEPRSRRGCGRGRVRRRSGPGDARTVHARVDDVPPRRPAGRAMGTRAGRRRAAASRRRRAATARRRRARCGGGRRLGVLAAAARVRQPGQRPPGSGRRRSRARAATSASSPARPSWDGSRRPPICDGGSACSRPPRSPAPSSGSARRARSPFAVEVSAR